MSLRFEHVLLRDAVKAVVKLCCYLATHTLTRPTGGRRLKWLGLSAAPALTVLPCPLERCQAEETETTQAEPVGEVGRRPELGHHLLSRRPKRRRNQQEDGSAEDSAQATCRLR